MTWNVKKISQWIRENPGVDPNPDARPGSPEEHAGLMHDFAPAKYEKLKTETLNELREELLNG